MRLPYVQLSAADPSLAADLRACRRVVILGTLQPPRPAEDREIRPAGSAHDTARTARTGHRCCRRGYPPSVLGGRGRDHHDELALSGGLQAMMLLFLQAVRSSSTLPDAAIERSTSTFCTTAKSFRWGAIMEHTLRRPVTPPARCLP